MLLVTMIFGMMFGLIDTWPSQIKSTLPGIVAMVDKIMLLAGGTIQCVIQVPHMFTT